MHGLIALDLYETRKGRRGVSFFRGSTVVTQTQQPDAFQTCNAVAPGIDQRSFIYQVYILLFN